MSTNTPINNLRIPESSDSPVRIATAVGNLANDADSRLVPRFATTTARDAAIDSPVAGQIAHVDTAGLGAQQLQYYNGASYELLARSRFARKTADDPKTTDNTLANDSELFVSVEANAVYKIDCLIVSASPLAADVAIRFTHPTSSEATFGQIALSTLVASNTVQASGIFGVSPMQASPSNTLLIGGADAATKTTALIKGLLVVGSTGGTLQFQWAQGSASGTTTLYKGSYLHAMQVA